MPLNSRGLEPRLERSVRIGMVVSSCRSGNVSRPRVICIYLPVRLQLFRRSQILSCLLSLAAECESWDNEEMRRCRRFSSFWLPSQLSHLGSAGLLWAINGGQLVELHRDWAVIELPVNRSQRTGGLSPHQK